MQSTSARIAIRASGFLSSHNRFALLKLAFTFVILAWLIYYLRSNDLLAVLWQIKPSAILLTLGLLPVNLGLQFLKWHYVLRCAAPRHITPRASFFSLLAGLPLGLITPGRWGELGRAFFLPQIKQTKVVLLAAMDKIFDLLINVLLGACALLYLIHKKLFPEMLFLPVVLLILCFAFMNVLALQPHALKSFARVLRKLHRKKFASLQALSRFSRRNLLAVWLLSLLFVLTYSLQFVILLRGFIDVAYFDGMIGAAATFFAKSLLPIAAGDLGVREGAAAFFFSRMGLLPQAAFDASLLLFVINLLAPSLLGMLLIWKEQTARRT